MSALLRGRSIVVTGAGGGLGRAYALACADAGAQVVVNDLDVGAAELVAGDIAAAGGIAVAAGGSVDSWDDARTVIWTAVERFGGLDGLVTNAGIKHEALPWEETERDLRRIVEVNVLGTHFCGVHAMRAMVESGGGGSIVTVVSGARLGISGMSAYGATKGAIEATTLGWAIDCAPVGIRVNAISPLAETPMATGDRRADRPSLGEPRAVAPLVVALLSEATADVTGQTFRFDGTSLSIYSPSKVGAGLDVSTHDSAAEIVAHVRRLGSTGGDAVPGPGPDVPVPPLSKPHAH